MCAYMLRSQAGARAPRGWPALHAAGPGKNPLGPNHIHTTLRWGRAPGKPSLAGACWAQTEFSSGCGAASPSQGPWDPDPSAQRLVWTVNWYNHFGKPFLSIELNDLVIQLLSVHSTEMHSSDHPKTCIRIPRGVRLRLEGKQRTALSSRAPTRISWSPLSGLKGVQPPLPFGERMSGKESAQGCLPKRLLGRPD